jgi:predicted RNA methylase
VNHLLDYLFAGLFHENQTFIFFQEHVKNAKVFVDVGANIGGYSIRAAKYCKVYAIESLPRNYKI